MPGHVSRHWTPFTHAVALLEYSLPHFCFVLLVPSRTILSHIFGGIPVDHLEQTICIWSPFLKTERAWWYRWSQTMLIGLRARECWQCMITHVSPDSFSDGTFTVKSGVLLKLTYSQFYWEDILNSDWRPLGTELDKGCEGQQERLLQVHQGQKKIKTRVNAGLLLNGERTWWQKTWKGQNTQSLNCFGLCNVRFVFSNHRSLRPVAKSGAMKTYPQCSLGFSLVWTNWTCSSPLDNDIHSQVLNELTSAIQRPLLVNFESSWWSVEVPEDWNKTNATLFSGRARRRIQEITG